MKKIITKEKPVVNLLKGIDGSTCINDVVKFDKEIRNHCRKVITHYHKSEVYNDIVNDVYIKLMTWWEKPENHLKIINSGFIHMLLNNHWINHIKKENNRNHNSDVIVNDSIVDDSFEDEALDSKYEDEILYELLEEKINNMHWYEQTLLEYSMKLDLKTISRKTNISYRSIRNTMAVIKQKLKQ